MYFDIDITILFEFEEYIIMEGDLVEVCVSVSGNSEIDIPVEITSRDVTANGTLFLFCFVLRTSFTIFFLSLYCRR